MSTTALANMMPGMEWIPLLGLGLVVLVVAGVAFFTFYLLKWIAPKRAAHRLGWSVFTGMALIVGFFAWCMNFSSPLPLPPGATDVHISRAFPLTLAIDDNLRFHASPEVFRACMEKLCQMPWASIASGTQGVDCTPSTGTPLGLNLPVWMDTAGGRGYRLSTRRGGLFSGTIVYNEDRQTVFYHFDD